MKKTAIIAFVLLCLIQLAIPSKMIFDVEQVMLLGQEYRFRTAPIDPEDPFRGKYVTLEFDAEIYRSAHEKEEWSPGEPVYVVLGRDSAGYAIVRAIRKQQPEAAEDYILAKIGYVRIDGIWIEYPFKRFYMEETKAPIAEKKYRALNQRSFLHEAYAIVYVYKGSAALKDVMIDGVSLRVLAVPKPE